MGLHVKNLSKTYHTSAESIDVLQDVSFDLTNGEWLTIIGPSGSGKSTLLHCIAGIVSADKNSDISFDDWNMGTASEKEKRKFRREKLGFIYQDYRLFHQFDALTNVMLPLMPYRKKEQLKEAATDLLNRVGLSERIHAMPTQLSGGEKQRVAIARALINQPNYVICDEPTGNLDKKNRDNVIELLQSVNETGTSIILVTHDLELMNLGNQKLTLGYQADIMTTVH